MFEKSSFHHFTPSADLESYANSRLGMVVQLAPSDSVITAELEKLPSGYKMRLQVESAEITRSVEVFADDPMVAVDLLEKEATELFMDWHRRRFEGSRSVPADFSRGF